MRTRTFVLYLFSCFLSVTLHAQNVDPKVKKGIDPGNDSRMTIIKSASGRKEFINSFSNTIQDKDMPRKAQRPQEFKEIKQESDKMELQRFSLVNMQNDSTQTTYSRIYAGNWLFRQNDAVEKNPVIKISDTLMLND